MKKLLLLGMGCLLMGCATTSTNSEALAARQKATSYLSEADLANWLEEFHDPSLQQLVMEALAYNSNLASAASVLASLEKPTPFSLSESKSRWIPCSFSTTRSNYFPADSPLTPWEQEVWSSLLWDTPFSVNDAQGARLSIATQTVKSWFDAVEAKLQLQLADEMLQNTSKEMQSSLERFKNGLGPASRVYQTRSHYSDNNIIVERALMHYRQTVHNLETLVGRSPVTELDAATELPALESPLSVASSLSAPEQDALAQEKFFVQREVNFKTAADSSWAAYEQTSESYKKGLTNFFDVLKSHQDALTAKSDWLASQRELLENRVNIYAASHRPQAVPSPKMEIQPTDPHP